MIGIPRYKTGENTEDYHFLGNYYKYDLYFDKKTKMIASYHSDHCGSICQPWLVKKVIDPKDESYPLKKARDLCIKFKLYKEEK